MEALFRRRLPAAPLSQHGTAAAAIYKQQQRTPHSKQQLQQTAHIAPRTANQATSCIDPFIRI